MMTSIFGWRCTRVWTLIALVTLVVAAAGGPVPLAAGAAAPADRAASTAAGERRPAGQTRTVRLGWVKVLQWAHWYDLTRYLDPSITVEFNEFKNSNEVLVALQSGSIDMGTIGFNHMAGILAKDVDTLQFVAGVSSGASRFVAARSADINTYADLKGKRVGGSRGSTQYMQAVVAMRKHGVDIDRDVQFTHLAGAADMQAALQRGEVDAAMLWEPNASQAILDGYAKDIPGVQATLYTDAFKISSGIAVRNAFVQEQPETVQKVIDAYYQSWKRMTADQDYWTSTFAQLTGLDKAVLDHAAPNCFLDFGLNAREIRFVSDLLASEGVIERNVTEKVMAALNYTFIERASGQSRQELGAE